MIMCCRAWEAARSGFYTAAGLAPIGDRRPFSRPQARGDQSGISPCLYRDGTHEDRRCRAIHARRRKHIDALGHVDAPHPACRGALPLLLWRVAPDGKSVWPDELRDPALWRT